MRGIDPETGNYYDDTKIYVDKLGLTPEQLKAMQQKGFESFGRMFKALGMKPE